MCWQVEDPETSSTRKCFEGPLAGTDTHVTAFSLHPIGA